MAVRVRMRRKLLTTGGQEKPSFVYGAFFRVLEIVKLAEMLEVHSTVADALAAFGTGD